jgi:5,10-methylenetetrahydrofolate reductase
VVEDRVSDGYGDIVAACARLRRAGFVPIPHIAARRLASVEDAVDFLRRVTDEAEVGEALLIGGDPDWPAGPFRDSLTFLASGIAECHGIERVRFAGYPEGHPHITARALDAALTAFARIITEAAPDALVDALVAGEAEGGAIDGLHVFTFGGVRCTAAWVQGAAGADAR